MLHKGWDADGHVYESEVTFSDKYWDPELRDRRPTVIEAADGPFSFSWLIDGRVFPVRSGPSHTPGYAALLGGKSKRARIVFDAHCLGAW